MAAAPAGADVASFGPNLDNLPANNSAEASCAHAPPGLLYPVNSPSCMWSYIDTYPNSLIAPATGTVTAVRVKVGATTGLMRVNVIRFLFRQTGDTAHPTSAGPFLEAYGPEFTPAANAVTPVATNLAMKEDPTPPVNDTETIQVIDALALEVESSNVPIPIFADGTALTYPVYPGPTAQGVPAPSPNALPSYSSIGYGVLMNADMTTAGAGGGGGPGPGAGGGGPAPGAGGGGPVPVGVPTVALPNATVPVKRGVAAIPVQCVGADCAGRVTLQRAGGGGARAAAKKTVTYGSAAFSAKAGALAKVKVKLNKAGRALLKHRRRAKILARVTFTSGGGAAKSFRLTLKR
jgi:hypothetical protein